MGSLSDHNDAMALGDRGDDCRRRGVLDAAAEYYLQAADSEQKALMAIPRERIRTRMIIARSLSWILWRHRKVLREMAREAAVSPVDGRNA